MDIHLGQFASRLLLLNGFSNPLSSMPLIEAAIQQQNADITAGKNFHFESVQTAGSGLELIFNQSDDISLLLSTHDLTIMPISPTSGVK
jgi:hypothetical protein